MSVLIKGMEMPKNCSVCRLFGEYGCPFIGAVGYALTRGERNDDCPLVPVPPQGEQMRLIDADEFKWQLTHWEDDKGWSYDVRKMVFDLTEIDEAIEKTPTVDAEPVRHGYWRLVTLPSDMFAGYRCSECTELVYGRTKYCHNCGAKMDESVGEET